MSFHGFVKLEEKRKEERITFESPEYISAVFKVEKGPEKDQLYELKVINHSSYGLGLIITEKDFNLLQILGTGDKIPEMILFAASILTKADVIVRHKTKIEDGKYKGNYILGLESNITMEEWLELFNSRGPFN